MTSGLANWLSLLKLVKLGIMHSLMLMLVNDAEAGIAALTDAEASISQSCEILFACIVHQGNVRA